MKALEIFKSIGMNIHEGKTMRGSPAAGILTGVGEWENEVYVLNHIAQHWGLKETLAHQT